MPVKIIRLTQTLGSGIDYNDTRVAAMFSRSVIESKNIVLKTPGLTKRPMLYTSDAISAVLTVLLKGENSQVYTAANPKTYMTVRKIANLIVKKIAHNSIKLVFDVGDIPAEYAQNMKLKINLDISKLSALGWKPEVGLLEAYEKMIEGMREERNA